MFNLSGSEIVFLLIIALVVLGPEKLPDAVRKFGHFYGEFKRMSSGFQTELRNVLDEPMKEMRDTADAMRKAANLDFEPNRASTATRADRRPPRNRHLRTSRPPRSSPRVNPSSPTPTLRRTMRRTRAREPPPHEGPLPGAAEATEAEDPRRRHDVHGAPRRSSAPG